MMSHNADVLHFLLYESYLPSPPIKGLPRDSTLRKYKNATVSEEEAKNWLMSGSGRNYETHRDDYWKTLCSICCVIEKNASEE